MLMATFVLFLFCWFSPEVETLVSLFKTALLQSFVLLPLPLHTLYLPNCHCHANNFSDSRLNGRTA